MVSKKAQSAVELLIVIGFVLFFFILFLGAIQSKIYDKGYEKKDIVLKDIVINVQSEINLAVESSDGYYREFKLPEDVLGDDYDILIDGGFVYAFTIDQKHAISIDIPKVNGTINKGENFIKKDGGEVFLN